jgi:hypothetical protein
MERRNNGQTMYHDFEVVIGGEERCEALKTTTNLSFGLIVLRTCMKCNERFLIHY